MKLLLHICCAPCSVMCIKSLRAEGIEPTGYWYNPNIHPVTEYRLRRDALKAYAESIGLALEVDDLYGLRPFAAATEGRFASRCTMCYASRMRHTARYAAEHGYTHFSTTLLYSVYQKHELLRAAAQEAAQEYGVTFLYRDFRPLYRQGQQEARALNLYMQKYCGCIFSEEERYVKRVGKIAAAITQNSDAEIARADPERLQNALWHAGQRFDAAVDLEEARMERYEHRTE